MRNKMKALSLLAATTTFGIATLALASNVNAAPRTPTGFTEHGTVNVTPSIWYPSGKPTVRPCYPRPCAVGPLTVGRR